MSDDKGQMSGFSGFLLFSALYYKSPMAAAHLSVTLAERNPPAKGELTPFFLAMRNGGDASEHPASGPPGTRGPTCTMPLERILKLVLLSEIHLLKDFFCNNHCSPLLQIALQSSDSHQCQGQPRARSEATVLPAATLYRKGQDLKELHWNGRKILKISFLLTFS